MKVVLLPRESSGSLTYLLDDPGSRALVVIDPTQYPYHYDEAVRAHGFELAGVWETHTHADHISSARALARGRSVPLWMPERAGATFPHQPISESTRLKVGDGEVRAIATPGHTPDAMTFLAEGDAIVGDTLLVGTVGRADFYPEGPSELYHSIFDKLLRLEDTVSLYPCHFGPKHGLPKERATTLGQ